MADEPKIFIDEDWKARAQREKEELQKRVEAESAARAVPSVPPSAPQLAPTDSDSIAPESPDTGEADMVGEDMEEGEPFEATFETLLSSLATQTMFALGVIPQPGGGGQVMVNLDQAKFSIDLMAMLREKTKGNLTTQEQEALDGTLAELQRMFVARVRQFEEQAMRQAGVDLTNLRTP